MVTKSLIFFNLFFWQSDVAQAQFKCAGPLKLFVCVAVVTDHNQFNVYEELRCMTQLNFLKLCICLWHSILQKFVD